MKQGKTEHRFISKVNNWILQMHHFWNQCICNEHYLWETCMPVHTLKPVCKFLSSYLKHRIAKRFFGGVFVITLKVMSKCFSQLIYCAYQNMSGLQWDVIGWDTNAWQWRLWCHVNDWVMDLSFCKHPPFFSTRYKVCDRCANAIHY